MIFWALISTFIITVTIGLIPSSKFFIAPKTFRGVFGTILIALFAEWVLVVEI